MNKTIVFKAAMTGTLVDLQAVPDPVISEKMMGDGLAIEPTGEQIVSPCDGTIVSIFPTKHAIGIETEDGLEVLIHIGIDTVNLKGKGFKLFVQEGQEVKTGQLLIQVKLKSVSKKVKSMVTPILITNMATVKQIKKYSGPVTCGEDIMMEVELK